MDDLLTAIESIPGIGPVIPYLVAAIAVCAALATRLPAPAQGASGVYPTFYAVVNFVAFNLGHARNATAPTTQPQVSKPLSAVAFACLLAGALSLTACTADEQAQTVTATTTLADLAAAHNSTVQKLVTEGALFCQKNLPVIQTATTAAAIVAVATGAGLAASVLNQGSDAVAATCAVLNAVPVSPPALPAIVPVVTVPSAALPPGVTPLPPVAS